MSEGGNEKISSCLLVYLTVCLYVCLFVGVCLCLSVGLFVRVTVCLTDFVSALENVPNLVLACT